MTDLQVVGSDADPAQGTYSPRQAAAAPLAPSGSAAAKTSPSESSDGTTSATLWDGRAAGEDSCGVKQASCVCDLPIGHDDKWHHCECGGEWCHGEDGFEVRSLPGTAPGFAFGGLW